ncbi:MAG: hypothetical protein C5S49_01390 [Candidatus Methanogaster sp.]|nr:MAG: hypothetical protein C5S49_01390 [ANME-2 cluster archaeon]
MKCPHCGAEVNGSDAFCGDCGKPLQREIEIAPPILHKIKSELNFTGKWTGLTRKWGSMTVSLVLTFIFWMFCVSEAYNEGMLIILLIFGFPATIYIMHKERTRKMKYGLVWILFPILVLLTSLDAGDVIFGGFLFIAIPAIVIDVIYVIYKTK